MKFVILMHQKPFLSLKTALFHVYGNIERVEGYSCQIYSCGKQFNLLEEYSPLWPWKPQKWTGHPKKPILISNMPLYFLWGRNGEKFGFDPFLGHL